MERNYIYNSLQIKELMKYHLARMVTATQVEIVPAKIEYIESKEIIREEQ